MAEIVPWCCTAKTDWATVARAAHAFKKKKRKSQITPTPKEKGLSARRSGGGGAAQGHPNQSSGTRSTTFSYVARGPAAQRAYGPSRLCICLVLRLDVQLQAVLGLEWHDDWAQARICHNHCNRKHHA